MIWAGGCVLSFLVLLLERKFPRKPINIDLRLCTLVLVLAVAGSGAGLYYYSVAFLAQRQAELREQAHWNFR
mgnify:FL=1